MQYARLLALALLALAALIVGPTPPVYAATFTVDSTGDATDFTTADGLCDTDDSGGDGPCTLRAAIQQANATAGTDTINFNIPGAGPHTVQPGSALPTITEPVIIDGTSEPDFAGTPIVELDGTNAGAGADGLNITAGLPPENGPRKSRPPPTSVARTSAARTSAPTPAARAQRLRLRAGGGPPASGGPSSERSGLLRRPMSG